MTSELESGRRRVGSVKEAIIRAKGFGTPTYLILAEEVERRGRIIEALLDVRPEALELAGLEEEWPD